MFMVTKHLNKCKFISNAVYYWDYFFAISAPFVCVYFKFFHDVLEHYVGTALRTLRLLNHLIKVPSSNFAWFGKSANEIIEMFHQVFSKKQYLDWVLNEMFRQDFSKMLNIILWNASGYQHWLATHKQTDRTIRMKLATEDSINTFRWL